MSLTERTRPIGWVPASQCYPRRPRRDSNAQPTDAKDYHLEPCPTGDSDLRTILWGRLRNRVRMPFLDWTIVYHSLSLLPSSDRLGRSHRQAWAELASVAPAEAGREITRIGTETRGVSSLLSSAPVRRVHFFAQPPIWPHDRA